MPKFTFSSQKFIGNNLSSFKPNLLLLSVIETSDNRAIAIFFEWIFLLEEEETVRQTQRRQLRVVFPLTFVDKTHAE